MYSERLNKPSRRWLMLAIAIGLAVALALSMAFALDAQAKKKKGKPKLVQAPLSQQSQVAQSGQSGVQTTDKNGVQAQITADGTPFTFSNANKFDKLNKVAITASIVDGDTGATELDRDNLTLVLDGIDTGVKLNDFTDGNDPVTNTVSGSLDPDVADQVLEKLKEDGKLAATIKDASPFDTPGGNSPDSIFIPVVNVTQPVGNVVSLPAGNQTTLKLDGKQTIKKKIKKHRRH